MMALMIKISFNFRQEMRKILLLLFVSLSCLLKAQNQVSGIVVDEHQEPVAFASISIIQASDSAFVTGLTTADDGRFTIETETAGRMLKVSYVGYTTKYLTPASDMTVTLVPETMTVGDVVITGSRPVYKTQKGMFVASVENTVLSKLGDGFDVLRQLPFVRNDGTSVSIMGRQGKPLVYINNRKMEDWEELRQLSSESIKEVKIITNPGSQYDASVSAVIRISTIRPVGEGLGGNVTVTMSQGDDFEHNERINLNYRHRSTDIFLGGYLTDVTTRGDHEETYRFRYHSNDYLANGEGKDHNRSNRLRMNAGFNHQLTDKQYVSMQYKFDTNLRRKTHMELDNLFSGSDENNTFKSITDGDYDNTRHSVNAFYSNQWNEKWQLNLDGTYVRVNSGTAIEEQENRFGTWGLVNTKNNFKTDVYAFKADLTTRLWGGELHWGTEESYTDSRQSYYVIQQDNSSIPNSDAASKQSSASLYASFQKGIGSFTYELGLRYEFVNFDFYQNGVKNTEDSKVYHNFFPNLSLSYQKNGFISSLGYRVTVGRPNYSDLQSGIKYVNSYLYYEGNPLLKPTYTHDISLMAGYKDLQIMLDYYHFQNASYQTLSFYQDEPIFLGRQENFNHGGWSASISYSPTISIWKPSFQVGISGQRLEYLGRKYNQPVFYYTWNNILNFKKDWKLVLDIDGYTYGSTGLYTTHTALISKVDAYLTKDLKHWSFRVGIEDAFHTFKDNGHEQTGNIYHYHYTDLRRQNVYLRITYRFNSARSKYRGGSAGESELNRL